VPVAIDVPDRDQLARQIAGMDGRPRIQHAKPYLELLDRGRADVEELFRERHEQAVGDGVADQRRSHGATLPVHRPG
jgi:hypothetical protein